MLLVFPHLIPPENKDGVFDFLDERCRKIVAAGTIRAEIGIGGTAHAEVRISGF